MFCKFDFRHSCMFNTTKFFGNEKKGRKIRDPIKDISSFISLSGRQRRVHFALLRQPSDLHGKGRLVVDGKFKI